jgi:hypothetical protein
MLAMMFESRHAASALARKMENFSRCAANFSLARKHLTPGFREIELQDAVESGALMLAPPSQAENDER